MRISLKQYAGYKFAKPIPVSDCQLGHATEFPYIFHWVVPAHKYYSLSHDTFHFQLNIVRTILRNFKKFHISHMNFSLSITLVWECIKYPFAHITRNHELNYRCFRFLALKQKNTVISALILSKISLI